MMVSTIEDLIIGSVSSAAKFWRQDTEGISLPFYIGEDVLLVLGTKKKQYVPVSEKRCFYQTKNEKKKKKKMCHNILC